MRVLFIVTLGSALAVSPASAATSGWEVHEAERFCYAWLPAGENRETDVGIAIDPAGEATLILSNGAWRLENGKRYSLVARMDAASRLERARGIRIRSDSGVVAVAAGVDDPSFVQVFAASDSARFEVQPAKGARGAPARLAILDRQDMEGAGEALAQVQRCAERKRNMITDMMVERQFRRDPPPAPKPDPTN